jgi:hypothetical protein
MLIQNAKSIVVQVEINFRRTSFILTPMNPMNKLYVQNVLYNIICPSKQTKWSMYVV